MEFGELQDVDLRAAWPHEATDFTPWLAENVERLAKAIGLPSLELEGREVAVAGFSADILARIPSDGSRVLIENQLENTDHSHLGQILTYLAGLEAQTVIWIAKDFREPHLSAIRWLNEHTTETFAFFAVKVRVVRIGNESSPVAPLFEVLERPNDWNRQVHAAEENSGNSRVSELRNFRNDFWRSYVQSYPGDIELRPEHVSANVYHRIEGMIISQWLGQSGVGIYMRANDPGYSEKQRREVEMHVEALREEFGEELGSRTSWERQSLTHPGLSFAIDATDRANWPRMIDWLHERLVDFRRIIAENTAQTLGE